MAATAAEIPETVAATVRENGHQMQPMPGAYDETHDCTRCGGRAYPMPGRRTEWIGWAVEMSCDEVLNLKGDN